MPVKLTRKRVLVTGGAGFLGSHLCEALLTQGHDVLCVDNYFTGRKDNIAHLLANPQFEAMRHDVTFPLYVEVDEIYNLACPASPIHYQFDPVQTTKTSRHRRDQHAGPRQAGEGQDPAGQHQRGLRRPRPSIRRPRTIAATSIRSGRAPATTRASAAPRRCSSTITGSTGCASRSCASSTPTARACTRTTAGWCRTSSSRRCAARRSRSTATASQTRAFCYVDDLVEGFIRLMDTPDDVTGPVNIGNPHEIPVRELAERIVAPDRLEVGDRLPAVAAGRPDAALPRHHAAPASAGLGADGGAGGGAAAHDRLFRATHVRPGWQALKRATTCREGLLSPSSAAMQTLSPSLHDPVGWHGTTILCVRRGGHVAMAGDGQVSLGQTVVKGNARRCAASAPAAPSSPASPARRPMPSRCWSGSRPSSSAFPASSSAPASNSRRTGAPTAICAGSRR